MLQFIFIFFILSITITIINIIIIVIIIIIINAYLLQKKLIWRLHLAEYSYFIITPDRQHSKTLILLANIDQNSMKQFSIAICRETGYKWQSKTLILAIFYPRLSIVKSVFDCHLSSVILVARDFWDMW